MHVCLGGGGGEEDDEGEENVNVSQRIARTQDATDLCIANLSHILSLSGSRCYVCMCMCAACLHTPSSY